MVDINNKEPMSLREAANGITDIVEQYLESNTNEKGNYPSINVSAIIGELDQVKHWVVQSIFEQRIDRKRIIGDTEN